MWSWLACAEEKQNTFPRNFDLRRKRVLLLSGEPMLSCRAFQRRSDTAEQIGRRVLEVFPREIAAATIGKISDRSAQRQRTF